MNEWKPIETAPKTEDIEVSYNDEHTEICEARWSDRPVCMGGPTVMLKAGWVTTGNDGPESNLPLDKPKYWREL